MSIDATRPKRSAPLMLAMTRLISDRSRRSGRSARRRSPVREVRLQSPWGNPCRSSVKTVCRNGHSACRCCEEAGPLRVTELVCVDDTPDRVGKRAPAGGVVERARSVTEKDDHPGHGARAHRLSLLEALRQSEHPLTAVDHCVPPGRHARAEADGTGALRIGNRVAQRARELASESWILQLARAQSPGLGRVGRLTIGKLTIKAEATEHHPQAEPQARLWSAHLHPGRASPKSSYG
jgi:hypothetical protein